ncbi:MAG: APC family permease [Deltaproteobacteria bacterium]|nr:APC family permease [Deltaproteobacteria bacterium]
MNKPSNDLSKLPQTVWGRVRNLLLGPTRNLYDPSLGHKVSLAAFLAWVGLGADGLSSSAYGPEEAFRALGSHSPLAIILVVMMTTTIFVISIAYSNLIQDFPGGGGGYLVATKLLGEKAGVVSGCALLVDYFLTISVSVAAGCDALWSFLPHSLIGFKLTAEVFALLFLVLLNLRGVKESVTLIAPVFVLFIVTHLFMILYAVGSHLTDLPVVFQETSTNFHDSVNTIGFFPLAMILLRAYSMGGGTYTGIEAVSNGVATLREPRVKTAKKTMFMMAISLAFTAGGILFSYLLTHSVPVAGKTMNAVLVQNLFGTWQIGDFSLGQAIVIITLVAEAALLFIAAQTGFIDGPRVLANMALDSWVPRHFAQLSDRLVTKNGVYLMGAAAIGTLLYTRGNVTMLVVMYSINVFITFVLTELGMSRHWIVERGKESRWKSQLAIHGTGLVMCLCILFITLYEKFSEGGWMTSAITCTVVALCFLIRRHYHTIRKDLKRLDDLLTVPIIPAQVAQNKILPTIDKSAPTAAVMVGGFSGFGLHQLMSIQMQFPNYFKNFIFISVGVLDSGNFKGAEGVQKIEDETRSHLEKYVTWCHQNGWPADYRMAIDTETISPLEELCQQVKEEFQQVTFFSGKLIFQHEKFFHRLLHHETALAIQRRLQFAGLPVIVLPIRVLES